MKFFASAAFLFAAQVMASSVTSFHEGDQINIVVCRNFWDAQNVTQSGPEKLRKAQVEDLVTTRKCKRMTGAVQPGFTFYIERPEKQGPGRVTVLNKDKVSDRGFQP